MSEAWSNAPAVVSREVLGPIDEPVARYVKAIDAASNLSELIDELARWPVLAADALEAAQAKDFDWDEWRTCLEMERKGKFAGETLAKRYGAIIMPAATIEPMMVAAKFHVPFGLAYLRPWETKPPQRRARKGAKR